jgi:3-methyl-2-oxobutanoate hydroxymethyltransferase
MKLNTRTIRKAKNTKSLNMLTAYDYQTAQLLNETELDLILVGDSLGNVILGYETTVEVTLEDMITFSSAVKRGAPNKFVVADLPFGTYATLQDGISNAIKLFQKSKVEAVKLEGCSLQKCELISELTENGIAVMGHLGLTPQSVHEQGGYYTHGRNVEGFHKILEDAKKLEAAGCFAVVLECVTSDLAKKITETITIPTIGIGSGSNVDGQVLVINDLLQMGKETPASFCKPIANLFDLKKSLIEKHLMAANQAQDIHHAKSISQ